MSATMPLVSIGMPVYNAQTLIGEAIDSILAQDYANFELIISDNASTDGTEDICRSYAQRDARIRYHRASENQGAVWNFNHVLELATGQYFMWAAHDDLRTERYVSRCVAVLEAAPDAVLCCTDVRFIDQAGRPVEPWDGLAGIRPVGRTARARAMTIARARCWWDYYGLIRTHVVRQTRGAQPVWGFDVVLLMEICLRGHIGLIPEPLFVYRVDPQKTASVMASTLGSVGGLERSVNVNWSAMAMELAAAIWMSPLGAARRVALVCEFLVRFCIFNGQTGAGMRRDAIPTARRYWSEKRHARAAALIALSVFVFPVQTRLGRRSYRLLKRLTRAGQSPA